MAIVQIQFEFWTYFAVSLIPIVFQSLVLFYLSRVWKYIGAKSAWLMFGLSIIGLIYDFVITGALLLRVGQDQPVTLIGIFLAFGFPIVRSGMMLGLTRLLAQGLAYRGRKRTKAQDKASED
jgi:hypothetical protein